MIRRLTAVKTGVSFLVAVSLSHATETLTQEQTNFFESKIRPVLADNCYKCHSQKAEKVKGGLMLDTREGIRTGGENGPAVVPGDLEKSLLIQAVRYTDPDREMPPKAKGGKLPDNVIADLEQWVKMGAPDPRDGAPAKIAKRYDTEASKKWWAYQPIQKPEVPRPKDAAWAHGDIDRFILAELEAKGLKPVADADNYTLVRRIYFDLAGLPPTAEEVDGFVKEATQDQKAAIAKLVDQLLKSPRYGERWGRHWLDVARYSETCGRDLNLVFPEAWRYRDYVVAAFDEDKPFDQFIKEQIAGDLLPDKSDEERAKNLTATGFLAIGPKPINEAVARQFALDQADEQIDSTSQAFLGVTIACARCHDHKFDPISQRDYTAMAGIFLSTETRFGTPGGNQNRNASTLIELPSWLKVPMANRHIDPALWRKKYTAMQDYLQQRDDELSARGLMGAGLKADVKGKVMQQNGQAPRKGHLTDFELVRVTTIAAQLNAEVSTFNPDGSAKPMIMAVLDRPTTPPGPRRNGMTGGGPKRRSGFEMIADSPLFIRGDKEKPRDPVPRGLPTFLSHDYKAPIPSNTSGRLQLANWIASPENTLTSRVIVNRVWHWLFGRGIVSSPDNFGTTSNPPSHPALLDDLATKFVAEGWSIKKLIREIMLSRAYQLSSENNETDFTANPDNSLVWRMNQRRLDAESIRDAMIDASGDLDLTRRVGSLLADVGEGPVGGPRNHVITEDPILKASGNFRSLYLPIARGATVETLAVFDFADPSAVVGARETTTVPPQALYLMNNPFVHEKAAHLADRLLKSIPASNEPVDSKFDERFRLGCMLVWARPPYPDETKAAREYAAKSSASGKPEDLWSSICRSLFAAAEFRYLN